MCYGMEDYLCQTGQQGMLTKIRIGNKLVITVDAYFVWKINCKMVITNLRNIIVLSVRKNIKSGHAIPPQ